MAETQFYRVLSQYYDELFPAEEATLNFLTAQLSSREPILDAACGSGNYTHALIKQGLDVYGVDSEPEMIALARAKGHSGRFFVGDILKLHELAPAPFGGVFCIGNSLSHLSSQSAVGSFVARAREGLLTGQPLLVQLMNPERLKPNTAVALPSLEASGVTMHRHYTYSPELGTIEFAARLVTDTQENLEINQTLLAITEEVLRAQLLAAGFTTIEVTADFLGAVFERDSSPMLVVNASASHASR